MRWGRGLEGRVAEVVGREAGKEGDHDDEKGRTVIGGRVGKKEEREKDGGKNIYMDGGVTKLLGEEGWKEEAEIDRTVIGRRSGEKKRKKEGKDVREIVENYRDKQEKAYCK